jgi:hypothetical protein
MTLLLARIKELGVGGDLIEMSSAVPRRKGTKGVTSNAIRGWTPLPEGLVRSLPTNPVGTASFMSKASISPGVTTITHSSGCNTSHAPRSDHEKIDATVFEAFVA